MHTFTLSLSPSAWLGPEASAAPEDAEQRSAEPGTQRDALEEFVPDLWG